MYYLIALPVLFLAWIVYVVSSRFNLKIFAFISKLIIIISVIAFIYFYADYYGFNIIDFVVEKAEEIFKLNK